MPSSTLLRGALAALATTPAFGPALAHDAPAPQQVIVEGHYDNAVGTSDAASEGVIRSNLLKSRPALRPGEVLEFVPGVIVTQHSGDGKANQYFLRGFNLDHGTDFATTVNGVPVNMPSHGHGQGYSDLNFLIPELVDRIAYRKGPYFATSGDFSAAGSADIAYRRSFEQPFASLTLGRHNYTRLVTGGSGTVGPGLTLLGAIELQHNDGPWVQPENLRKNNGVLTLSGGSAVEGFSASVMSYAAHWTATDQVPQGLIASGGIDRYGTLDPSDGGHTERSSVSGEWHRSDEGGTTRVAAYAMDYRLKLYSDFTYFLARPEGDQFSQQDARKVFGLNASRAIDHALAGFEARTEFGLQLRHDRIAVGLYDSVAGALTGTVRSDRIRQASAGLYAQSAVVWTPWLRSVLGLRADQMDMHVNSLSNAANSGHANAHLLSPKLSLVAGPWQRTELFFNAGRGFHSNDARGATDATAAVAPLVPARGMEVGARSEWLPGLQSSIALWKLDFDSELVYVGDEGVTEANRASRRHGVEWNNRWTPRRWLLVDADFAWSHARFRGHEDGGDHIPNAVDKVASVALTLRELGPWSGSLQWRYLGSGPLVEDNSRRSPPSLTTNLRVTRQLTPGLELTLDVFNLFDRKVDDIAYFYRSRPLPGGPAVDDLHVHPAEPRTARVTVAAKF